MTSLENQLEGAYAAVAMANEPTLAGVVTPRLSTLLLAQAPEPGNDRDEVEQVPVPYALLTAKRSEESIPNSGILKWNSPLKLATTPKMPVKTAVVWMPSFRLSFAH